MTRFPQRAALGLGLAWLVGFATTACNTPPGRSPDGGKSAGARRSDTPTGQERGQERLQRLEREARALARADGCQSAGECRTAPVGDRPCGGPRTYLVYCARTTDSAALFRKLDELARAERSYNQEQGLMSTCEFRMPPTVEASGGSCRPAP
jgi:hypothetical protein